MKKITLIISACLLLQYSYAQVLVKRDTIYPEQESQDTSIEKKEPKKEVETLFQSQKGFGGYFGLTMGYSNINGQDALVAGGRFMFVANHYLGIGIGGKGFVTTPMSIIDEVYTYSAGGYGGLYLEPVILSLKPVHIAIPILIGGGGIYNEYIVNYTESAFFIIEPGIDVELNIAKWFRIGLGASYKFTSKLESLPNQPTDLLNGFNYGLTFKFGWF